MSDNDEDLFADSDDTAELINSSKPAPKPAATKKLGAASAKRKRNEGKSKKPDADADSDSDDKGLFDSDDDSDVPPAKKKAAPAKKPLSKRERMEALQKRKRAADGDSGSKKVVSDVPKEAKKPSGADSDSEDSYNSRDFQLTAEDRDFIDTEGDDADAVNELYSEQHFDDERGEAEEMHSKKKGRGGGGGSRRRRDDEAMEDNGDLDNPIMAAVHKMKKKKREAKKITELEEEGQTFILRMDQAAKEDEAAIRERRPAMNKLKLLQSEVIPMLARRDMTRVLLDLDLLSSCRRWVQPLSNGSLGNVTIRQKLLDSIANMTGESGITPHDLKKSEFGKVVMSLYMHPSETPAMKRQLKGMIEQWSRPIFQKSGNMRDLERVHGARGAGLARISREMQQPDSASAAPSTSYKGSKDIDTMIKSGKGKTKSSLNRVRVPYSKGFQFTVRPNARAVGGTPEKGKAAEGARGNLKKRMIEKGRAVSKNQRSANISIEGRVTKG